LNNFRNLILFIFSAWAIVILYVDDSDILDIIFLTIWINMPILVINIIEKRLAEFITIKRSSETILLVHRTILIILPAIVIGFYQLKMTALLYEIGSLQEAGVIYLWLPFIAIKYILLTSIILFVLNFGYKYFYDK
jgi:hypothetical protein